MFHVLFNVALLMSVVAGAPKAVDMNVSESVGGLIVLCCTFVFRVGFRWLAVLHDRLQFTPTWWRNARLT